MALKKPKEEPEPSAQEEAIIRSLLYDTLLGSQPLIACNVRSALQLLLTQIGRPKLGLLVERL